MIWRNQLCRYQEAALAVPLTMVMTSPDWRPALAAGPPGVTAAIDIQRIMEMIPHRYPFLLLDRVVEIEDPQVERIGGRPEPPPGTFSRFLHPQGWRVGGGEGVVVPLNLPPAAGVRVEGWLDGGDTAGVTLLAGWNGAAPSAEARFRDSRASAARS